MVIVIAVFLMITIGFSFMIGGLWVGGYYKFTNIIENQNWFGKIVVGFLVVFLMIWYAFIARFFYKIIWNKND